MLTNLEAMAARWEDEEAAREELHYVEAVEAGFSGTLADYRSEKVRLMDPTTDVWELSVVPASDDLPF